MKVTILYVAPNNEYINTGHEKSESNWGCMVKLWAQHSSSLKLKNPLIT